jgi:hypothetical protein
MRRRADALSDATLREGREVTVTGRIAATIPCPGENALWVTVKVEGDQWVEVGSP